MLVLFAGVRLGSPVLRIASAVVFAVAVGKVFLFDMSELEGVLRLDAVLFRTAANRDHVGASLLLSRADNLERRLVALTPSEPKEGAAPCEHCGSPEGSAAHFRDGNWCCALVPYTNLCPKCDGRGFTREYIDGARESDKCGWCHGGGVVPGEPKEGECPYCNGTTVVYVDGLPREQPCIGCDAGLEANIAWREARQ